MGRRKRGIEARPLRPVSVILSLSGGVMAAMALSTIDMADSLIG
jgi:hypothetical protein